MNQKQEKPYKHYARPSESRTTIYKSHSKGWLITLALLVIVMIALVPIVHHLASSSQTKEQAVELQKTTKKSVKSVKQKQSAKSKHKKAKTSVKVKAKKKTTKRKSNKYVVQDGDTLNSIAQKKNVSSKVLTKLNNLDDDGHVNAGQTLKLK
ncbi:LysM domain-containing protein [Lactobacillus sp. ESL0701]|uniref:LysM peptidoglycan-binding domain-containing protein n=1 Tax=Lactobacillus sp. ESL0701 TaxID=2983217 RepID=UPI0023F9D740|nr:LysM domain-containing protein [Lactobacillus sp. ESL0701]MDF7672058.1 LysM domain-containing protein [Lactobacillus sp. ESL0701]